MTKESLLSAVRDTWTSRKNYIEAMEKSDAADGVAAVMAQILGVLGEN